MDQDHGPLKSWKTTLNVRFSSWKGGVLSVILSIFTLIVRFEPLDDAVDLDEDDVAVAAVLAPGDEPVAR